jgi:hypothetical protein
MEQRRCGLVVSVGFIFLILSWFQPRLALTLLPVVAILLLPRFVRRSRFQRTPRHVRRWLAAFLLLALLPLLLPSDAEERQRRCLFSGTAAQTQTCLAAQQMVIMQRLLIYMGEYRTCL